MWDVFNVPKYRTWPTYIRVWAILLLWSYMDLSEVFWKIFNLTFLAWFLVNINSPLRFRNVLWKREVFSDDKCSEEFFTIVTIEINWTYGVNITKVTGWDKFRRKTFEKFVLQTSPGVWVGDQSEGPYFFYCRFVRRGVWSFLVIQPRSFFLMAITSRLVNLDRIVPGMTVA